VLRLDGVTIAQGAFRLTADWSVPAAARVAVIGPSGAGKSTLLHAIAGFAPVSSGRILWQGQDIGPLAPGDRPLTLLFQDQNLFPHLTVRQNVTLGLSPGLRPTDPQRAAVAAALEKVGLAGLDDRRPGSLSGGQQGRVALARALVRARPLLLLDEPFAALGPALRSEMAALVGEVAAAGGATVLTVTHDAGEARATPLTVLVDGGVAHPPVPSDVLFADPPPALRAYLGA
jgi:thiamine transport system ATP-binding protein